MILNSFRGFGPLPAAWGILFMANFESGASDRNRHSSDRNASDDHLNQAGKRL